MKRIAWITALLCCMTAEAGAQDWRGLLRGLFGSSNKETETEQTAPEPASKHLTAQELAGTWVYAGAVIRYTGDDLLASMAVSALQGQIEEYCTKAGVVVGRDRVTLDGKGGAVVRIDQREAKGSYRYDPATGSIRIEIAIRGKQGILTGTTEYENGTLTLLFNAREALDAMKAAAPQLAQNEKVKMASTLIDQYPGLMIGAKATR